MKPTRIVGGRYVVLSELGRGGTGVVWRAEDRVTGRAVAVKQLHVPPGSTARERRRYRERLLRETRLASRLDDPGIVTVHDVITDESPDGVLHDHLVMELLEGRSLATVVADDGPLDADAAAAVGRRVLSALRAAHAGGVLHRDVTPGNVLLAAGGRVGLTDFGVTGEAPTDSVRYLAPERHGGGPATPAADLWALGATLFHAVEGAAPAGGPAEPTPTRCRGPLADVITGLLHRDPAARLTAAGAAALLDPPDRRPEGTPRLPAARAWIALAVVVAFVIGVLVGAVVF